MFKPKKVTPPEDAAVTESEIESSEALREGKNVETIVYGSKTTKDTMKSRWQRRSLGSKIFLITGYVLTLLVLALLLMMAFARQVFGEELGDLILGPGVPNGFVTLGKILANSAGSWFISLVVIVLTVAIVTIINIFISIFTSGGTRRTKTIASLVRSFVRYIAVVVAIGAILTAWGVDVASIVAGVGVMTLVIGLGCQSLIQDVISGIFIVFDDYFTVGDIVIIDGFRGTISEVGLKSTKLIDASGNIKSIVNSAIKTVANLSRADTLVSSKMTAAYGEDVTYVEGVLTEAMPELKKKIPAITEGPWYKGIDSFDECGIHYLVLCKCKEADKFQVGRDLNRELYLLFVDNGIEVPLPNVVTVQEKPRTRKKPTAEQIASATRNTDENRGIIRTAKPKKKKNLLERTKAAIEEETKFGTD